MNYSMILAMDENGLIGNKNKLPWHLPKDLKHFKTVTTNKIVVMGRKTYESIGRPLPNRLNIVITRDVSYKAEGVIVLNSIEELNEFTKDKEQEVIIIGGAELIKQLYSYISSLYITHVEGFFEGDCFIDFIDFNELKLINEDYSPSDDENKHNCNFCFYQK